MLIRIEAVAESGLFHVRRVHPTRSQVLIRIEAVAESGPSPQLPGRENLKTEVLIRIEAVAESGQATRRVQHSARCRVLIRIEAVAESGPAEAKDAPDGWVRAYPH